MSKRTTTPVPSADNDQAVFAMLDRIREEGTMNMFHAPQLLQDQGYERNEALRLFEAWTKRYEA